MWVDRFPLHPEVKSTQIKINCVQTRCIVKGEAQKSPTFLVIFGGFCFLSGAPVLQEFHQKTFKINRFTDFTTPLANLLVFTMPLVWATNRTCENRTCEN